MIGKRRQASTGEIDCQPFFHPHPKPPRWDFAGVVGQVRRPRPIARRAAGESVSIAVAATLPVAGLTALYTLSEGGLLIGKSILINGASGGVGHLAVQLAHASGAFVVAAVRRETQREQAVTDGADRVLVSEDLADAGARDPFDLILESAGGAALGHALGALAAGGTCVSFGNSTRTATTFDPFAFLHPHGGTRLVGFFLLAHLKTVRASEGLGRLARLIEHRLLQPRIDVHTSWNDVDSVIDRFMPRRISGKAVLTISDDHV